MCLVEYSTHSKWSSSVCYKMKYFMSFISGLMSSVKTRNAYQHTDTLFFRCIHSNSVVQYNSVLRPPDIGSNNISSPRKRFFDLYQKACAYMMLPVPVIVVFSNSSSVSLLKNAGGDLQVVRKKNVFSST